MCGRGNAGGDAAGVGEILGVAGAVIGRLDVQEIGEHVQAFLKMFTAAMDLRNTTVGLLES